MRGRSWGTQDGVGRTCYHTSRRWVGFIKAGSDIGTEFTLQSETYTPATPNIQAQYPASPDLRPHGTRGPVGSSYPPFSFDQIKQWYKGWSSLGVLINSQSNAGLAIGAMHSSNSLAQPNVSRSSASDAYYKGDPSMRKNFHLLTSHRVVKIMFDGTRATGVEVSVVMQTIKVRF